MDAAAVKPEASSEHKKSMKVPNISFTTVQLADTVTQDAVRSGKPGSKPKVDDAKTSEESVVKLKEVVVVEKGRGTSLIGETQSASQGLIGQTQIKNRVFSRVGEVLEFIPGMIATEQAGSGKANQYFLRGFNLDHGTDFAAFHDGVPVNMRTHGHGQGYLDLGFVIPELVDNVTFAKGPYRAENGDFATAASARFRTVDTLPAPFLKAEMGTSDYYRLVAAGSTKLGSGDVLVGIEAKCDDGPYDLAQKVRLHSGFAKWTGPLGSGTLRASRAHDLR